MGLINRAKRLAHPRLWAGAGLLLWAAAPAALASWFADDPPSSVRDLRYGVALYQYYQDKHLEALSELLVADALGGIEGHGDNPAIMTGGFYLAYGMQDTAKAIFDRLLDANRPQATRDAAWFYLARLGYLRGDYDTTETLLERVSAKPAPTLALEADVLRFNIALQRGELDQARSRLDNPALRKSDWLPYLQYNLGAALSRGQHWQRASAWFSQLGEMRQRSPEHLALYDKAMTALGYSRLFAGDEAGAIDGFRQVRLESPMSSRALLGYGWAAYAQENYREALKPWQALAEFRPVDANVQEAWVAIPTVYEKLGFADAALSRYRDAEAGYQREIARLDDALSKINGSAIREALNIDRSADFNWLDYAEQSALAPELTYLVPLFAEDRFLRQVQQLRDLLAIQTNLLQWQQKLQLYQGMIALREANRGEQLAELNARNLDAAIAELVNRRHELGQILGEQQSQPDFLALVAVAEKPKRERILNASRNAETLRRAGAAAADVIAPRELAQLSATARIHEGLLVWRSALMHEERWQRAAAELAEVDQALDDIHAVKARIEATLALGFDLNPYRQGLEQAEEKLLLQLTDVEIVIHQAQDALRSQVSRQLNDQRLRLEHYLGQARLAIARMLERAAPDAYSAEEPL